MFGVVFLLAEEGKRFKNCGFCICCDMYIGSASALGAGVPGKNSVDVSWYGTYRDLFCVVAVSPLRSGQLDRAGVAEEAGEKVRLR